MARELPHDQEAERSLLGAMIISKETCQSFVDKANVNDFYEEKHRLLFMAMYELTKQNTPVDITTITTYLKDHGQLDKVGGVEYLLRLSESVPTVAHSDFYFKIIHDKAILRKIIHETTKIAEDAFQDVENIDDFIDNTERTMLSISKDRNAGEFVDVRSILK